MKTILLAAIQLYKYAISPALGNNCRFYPSCSSYALESISKHGSTKGLYLTTRRLLKCHPLHQGGIDLVPEKFGNNKHG